MKGPGQRPTGDTYSVAQVAVLLLLTPQIWMRSVSGDLPSTRAEVACHRCFGKREIRFTRPAVPGVVYVDRCPECGGRTTSSMEIADALADLARGISDPTQISIALADLGMAWGRIGEGARVAIGEFLKMGPSHVGHSEIEFQRSAHRSAILRLWRAINGFGEYERGKGSSGGDGQASRPVHAARSRRGDVRRLQASDPHDDGGTEGAREVLRGLSVARVA